MKIFTKRQIILPVSLLLLTTISIASTYAWFAGKLYPIGEGEKIEVKDSGTILVHSPTVTMGTVDITLAEQNFNNNTGNFIIANASNINIAVRVGLIPYWTDEDNNPALTDTGGITVTTNSGDNNWTAVSSKDGKWFLVYIGGNNIEGYGSVEANAAIPAGSFKVEADPPNGNYTLRVEVIAEAVQCTSKAIKDAWGDMKAEEVYTYEE